MMSPRAIIRNWSWIYDFSDSGMSFEYKKGLPEL